MPFAASSCTGSSEEVSVRSLERTGHVAFICAGKPGSAASLRPLSSCNSDRREEVTDFGTDETAGHIYAIVTLETRGEVAVVDVTSRRSNVLDQDISTPGDSALPVGAQPVDIVATPLGTAVFVASAETARPGLYALDAEALRPCEVNSDRCETSPPTLSSWPACRLPSVPGAMTLIADPPDEEGLVRRSCDGDYEPTAGDDPAFGDIDREGFGRQKLYVTLPREGRVVVVDAQSLFTSEAGSFEDCVIEREVNLTSEVPGVVQPPPIEDGPACAVPEEIEPRPGGIYASIPAGLSLSIPVGVTSPGATGATLFIADLGAPIIHVLDLADPCDPSESTPLVPTSLEDPSRIVVTDRVAASGLTPSGHRYVYATDIEDKSVMVFDVSNGTAGVQPASRSHPEYNPFQPPDRVRFASAPVDVLVLERDVAKQTPTGIAPVGTQCDPDPDCLSNDPECSIGSIYRTSGDYETGASPFELRGVFGAVALASGQVQIIDVEDFDAPCRGPSNQSEFLGCGEGDEDGLKTTDEPSCNVVSQYEPRSSNFLLTNDDLGRHEPGLQTFPALSLDDGTVLSTNAPVIRVPSGTTRDVVSITGELLTIGDKGAVSDDEGLRNTLLLNLRNPRVHQADQEWALTYQGALPGFTSRVGNLNLDEHTLVDTTARFCGRGVQPENAARLMLQEEGVEGSDLEEQAARLADRLHVAEPLATIDDPYWDNVSVCTFSDCRATFGEAEVPTPARDIRIVEATEDLLQLGSPDGATEEFFECCFPTLVDYEIRPGDEWTLVGGASGFVHNVIADPAEGDVCRPSCDPRLAARTSRARYIVGDTETRPVGEDPRVFDNALFRFAIVVPLEDGGTTPRLERDMTFRFITQSSFVPLRATLTSDDRRSVQIQSFGYLPATDEIFATDGALEGLLLLPSDLVSDVRQFY